MWQCACMYKSLFIFTFVEVSLWVGRFVVFIATVLLWLNFNPNKITHYPIDFLTMQSPNQLCIYSFIIVLRQIHYFAICRKNRSGMCLVHPVIKNLSSALLI